MTKIDQGRGTSVERFEKDAKKILWTKSRKVGRNRPEYDAWKTRIAEISAQEKVSRNEAVLRASSECTCLAPLMNEYDFESYGIVGSPNIGNVGVVCQNIKQTYRENLRWALNAAGEFQRSHVDPVECPNNSAWYLYVQAIQDPKDFLQKLGQVEAKVLESEHEAEDTKRHSKRSVSELNEQLATLEEEGEECEI